MPIEAANWLKFKVIANYSVEIVLAATGMNRQDEFAPMIGLCRTLAVVSDVIELMK